MDENQLEGGSMLFEEIDIIVAWIHKIYKLQEIICIGKWSAESNDPSSTWRFRKLAAKRKPGATTINNREAVH